MTVHRRGRKTALCLRCGNMKIHEARGLCKCCYNHLRERRCGATEFLDQYPPLGGYGAHSTAHAHNTAADRIRMKTDPGFIPMREARLDYTE